MLSTLHGSAGLRVALGLVFVPLLVRAPFCGAQDVRKAPQTQPATQPSTKPAVPKVVVPSTTEITEQAVRAKIQAVTGAAGIKDEDRKAVLALYNQALEQLRSAKESGEKAGAFEQAAKHAPARLRALNEAATQPATQPAVEIPKDLPLADAEAKLKTHQLQLTDLEKQSAAMAAEVKDRQARRAQLPDKLAQAQDKLKDVQDRLAKLPASTDPQRVKDARQALLKSTQQALQAEIDAYQKEIVTYDTRGALLRAEQNALASRIARLQATIKVWDEAVGRLRAEQTKRQLAAARRAEQEAAEKHVLVQDLRKKNRTLAELRAGPEGLTAKQKDVSERLRSAKDQTTQLQTSLEKIRKMVAEEVSADLIAILLRQQRTRLPDVRTYRQRGAARRAEIAQARLRLMELNELASKCSDVAAQAQALVASAKPAVPPHQKDDVLGEVRQALQDRKQLLEPLIQDFEAYANALLELNGAERKLVSVTEEFADYISERILWTRSTAPLGVADIGRCGAALAWLTDAESWRDVPPALWRGFRSRLVRAILVLLVLGALVAFRGRLVAGMAAPGVGFRRSVHQLLLVAGLAVVAPGAMWLVGWLLASGASQAVLPFALGRGLIVTAAVWLPLAVFRQICRRRGPAAAQFGWRADGMTRIRRCLLVLAAAGLPLVFLCAVLDAQSSAAHRDSLGRLALMAVLVISAIWLGRLLHPRGRLVRHSRAAQERNWAYRLRLVWYPIVVGAPPALAVAAAAGYHYTASHLAARLWVQAWLVVALIVLQALFHRWIQAARQRLALRTRARRGPVAAPAGGPEPAVADAAIQAEEEEIDASAADAQTSQLVRYLIAALLLVGIWGVWADVLPALNVLHRVELWSVSADAARVPVTLAHLGLAILVVVLTVVAARNIPGMLEITLLQRLRMDAGARYAVSHLARYTISVVGMVMAVNLLGVRWQHVQWLVAAVTVGLGFGLQEIFGNFVSGLILLFERPIRVGDVVTIGDVTGRVTRIRIRATTITSWDRKELIVPNKEFITGRLVNWTLSDNVIRVVIPVGIAYGSNTELARKTMVEVAKAHEHVLSDPEPYAIFTGFGDSSLNFELRVYVSGLESYLAVLNDMHMQVDQTFREADIEIAFPQRDIHIRSVQAALPVETRPGEGGDNVQAVDPPQGL